MYKYMLHNGVEVTSKNFIWGNFDDVEILGLTGYYTNVDENGTTDGFKNCNELVGNKTNSSENTYVLLTTGASEQVKKMNIYDMAGNLWEWADEAVYFENHKQYITSEYNTYSIRSGFFNGSHKIMSMCIRGGATAMNTQVTIGFRVALYLL